MLRYLSSFGALALVTILAGSACSTGSDCDFGLCAGTPAGTTIVVGADGGPVNVVPDTKPPPGCDASADPSSKEAAPCIDEAFALFVDAAAAASGDGTRAHPFSTIGAALAKVPSSGKRRVYICGSSSFAEHVQMNAANAANLHGGIACGRWAADTTLKPSIVPRDVGYALQVTGVPATRELVVSNCALAAADLSGAHDGSSSIGVAIDSSTAAFLRVDVVANAAARGAEGAPGAIGKLLTVSLTDVQVQPPLDPNGDPAAGASGREKECTCDTTGAAITSGGAGGNTSGAGSDGSPLTYSGSTTMGTGGSAGCSTGKEGALGPSGEAAAKLTTRGTLSGPGGWTPARGADATKGGNIGGGGGGGGGAAGAKFGGGGGCGGCGNGPGKGGGGGGASIGIIAVGSALTFGDSTIRTGSGGAGGSGGTGGVGGQGGQGALGAQGGCSGGMGGQGGAGGGGAGGAGGLSVGILFDHSTLGNVDAISPNIQVGSPGAAGPGGLMNVNEGIGGRAEKVLDYASVDR